MAYKITEGCNACNNCVEACPMGAIFYPDDCGKYGSPKIDPNKCIECGECVDGCSGDAIKLLEE